ncbi:MAG: sensor histidine kinase [Marinifilaceae bacterium]
MVKTIIDVFWVNYYFDLLVKHKELTDKKGIILLMLVLNALSHFIILFCSFAVGFIIQYSISRKKNQQLTEAKLQAEISFLKMQLNPHLLFNTLNHFYALALKDKNKGLADGITQLSEMMRYMLYETNVEKIPLNKEITYIQSYLDLFAMRLHSNRADWIDFKSEGDIDQFRIAPMLLISFVENALKHGKKGDSKEKIRIHLKAKSNQLHFQTINKIDSCNGVSKDTEGVGMDNVKKRLDLIYPNAYDLRINQDSNHFSVHLKLESL